MGIAKVCDILKHDRSFKSKIELETIYNITIPNMKYNKIISLLKSKIGNLPLGNNYSLETTIPQLCLIYLFIWGFTSLSTLYRSYHDG